MTYIYYKSSTHTTEPKISDKQIAEWRHLADKKNWRITQLPNGYYQTEVNKPDNLVIPLPCSQLATLASSAVRVQVRVEPDKVTIMSCL